MVIKGRSRSNGVQLADYLLNNRENDRAQILEVRGTAQPDSLKKSLLEMSMSSELTKRGKLGLYHAQVNPAIGEDRPMTPDDWIRAADILEQSLGFDGQKRAIVLHEKNGRVHGHIVWEKYDHDTGRLRTDSHNFKKHDQARAQIEQELGHERTPQKAQRDPTHKERLTDLWQQHPDGVAFVEAAQEAGYYIAQGNDRRPFRVVTPDGQSLDLVRQLEAIKTKAVRDRLQPIRDELWTEAEALQLSKADRDRVAEPTQPAPELSDNFREMSDSQDIAEAMINHYKQRDSKGPEQSKADIEEPVLEPTPSLPHEPERETLSDNVREMSDSQDVATGMLGHYKERQERLRRQAEQQEKVWEAKRQAREQTRKQDAPSITDEAAAMLEHYRQRQRERGQDRDGLEY